jgi:hypothetical protein
MERFLSIFFMGIVITFTLSLLSWPLQAQNLVFVFEFASLLALGFIIVGLMTGKNSLVMMIAVYSTVILLTLMCPTFRCSSAEEMKIYFYGVSVLGALSMIPAWLFVNTVAVLKKTYASVIPRRTGLPKPRRWETCQPMLVLLVALFCKPLAQAPKPGSRPHTSLN